MNVIVARYFGKQADDVVVVMKAKVMTKQRRIECMRALYANDAHSSHTAERFDNAPYDEQLKTAETFVRKYTGVSIEHNEQWEDTTIVHDYGMFSFPTKALISLG